MGCPDFRNFQIWHRASYVYCLRLCSIWSVLVGAVVAWKGTKFAANCTYSIPGPILEIPEIKEKVSSSIIITDINLINHEKTIILDMIALQRLESFI